MGLRRVVFVEPRPTDVEPSLQRPQYIVCPDNETSEDMDKLRMAWGASDLLLNRPALSRWHPECELQLSSLLYAMLKAWISKLTSRFYLFVSFHRQAKVRGMCVSLFLFSLFLPSAVLFETPADALSTSSISSYSTPPSISRLQPLLRHARRTQPCCPGSISLSRTRRRRLPYSLRRASRQRLLWRSRG